MAVYGVDIRTGLARNGQIAFTGWSPTLGQGNAPPQVGGGFTTGAVAFNGLFQNDDLIAKHFRKPSPAVKQLRSMIFNLIGANVGIGTTTNTYKRVQGVDINSRAGAGGGGLRVIENVGYVNRATTAADQTAIREMMIRNVYPTTGAASSNGRSSFYPTDVSRNGGGGKVKF